MKPITLILCFSFLTIGLLFVLTVSQFSTNATPKNIVSKVSSPSSKDSYQQIPSGESQHIAAKEKPLNLEETDPQSKISEMIAALESATPEEAANISADLEQLGSLALPSLINALGLPQEELAMGVISNTLARIGDPIGIKAIVDAAALSFDPGTSLAILSGLAGLSSSDSASFLADTVLESGRYSDAIMDQSDPVLISACIEQVIRLADEDLMINLVMLRSQNTLDGEERMILDQMIEGMAWDR